MLETVEENTPPNRLLPQLQLQRYVFYTIVRQWPIVNGQLSIVRMLMSRQETEY